MCHARLYRGRAKGADFIDLTHPDDLEADLALAQKLLAGEIASYRIEKRYLHKNGSVVWGDLAVSFVRDTNGQPKYAVGVVVDITERRQAEARLGAVLASINDHLACYDRQWRYTFVNDRAAQVLGKRKEELLGKSIWELFPDAVGNQYYQELHEVAGRAAGHPLRALLRPVSRRGSRTTFIRPRTV